MHPVPAVVVYAYLAGLVMKGTVYERRMKWLIAEVEFEVLLPSSFF